MPPKYVKRDKNDWKDAEACAESCQRLVHQLRALRLERGTAAPQGQWHSFSGGGLRYRFARLENGRASHFFLLGLQRSSGRRETRG